MTPLHRVLRSEQWQDGRPVMWAPIGGNGPHRPGISSAELKDWIAKGFVEVLERKQSVGNKMKKLIALTELGKAAALAGYRFHAVLEVVIVQPTGFMVGDENVESTDILVAMALVKAKPRGTEVRRLPDNALIAVR